MMMVIDRQNLFEQEVRKVSREQPTLVPVKLQVLLVLDGRKRLTETIHDTAYIAAGLKHRAASDADFRTKAMARIVQQLRTKMLSERESLCVCCKERRPATSALGTM